MDHLELRRELPRGLVAIVLRLLAGLVAVLVVVGCAPDESTSSFGRGSTTEPALPTVTTADTPTDDDNGATGDAADGATTSSSATTEPPATLQGLASRVVADGFDQPIHVTSAPGSDRLFVVEREGLIHTVGPDGVDPEPFLDARDRLLSSSIEQGLLGLVFHPGFADNGRLFAYWTDTDGDSVLAEFAASIGADGVPVLDEGSQRTVLQIDQPAERHNAGMLAFGPEGLLYVAVGDGGSGGSTAQDTDNLLGTILRLDVDRGGSGAEDAYAIPDDNPFGDEIWVYGLRNPWRFWIDDEADLVYIGDVGQERFEELNVIGLDGAGTNFGWFVTEGDQCFRSGCDTDGLTPPVLQYGREEGCSITGGVVYRGDRIPEFDGHYFYGDWCKGFVRSLRFDGGRVQEQFDWTDELGMGQVTSFGVGPDGELYAVNWEGELLKVVAER